MGEERHDTAAAGAGPGGRQQAVSFVDHHCHSLLRSWPAAAGAEWPAWRRCFTESTDERVLARDVPELLGYHRFLSTIAPLVGAESSAEQAVVTARDRVAGADPARYLRMLLDDCATGSLLIDTGYGGPGTLDLGELEAAAGRPVREVVRLEPLVEALLGEGGQATGSLDALVEAFETRVGEAIKGGAVALKSVLAYRAGLRLPASGRAELRRAFTELDRAAQARRFDDAVLEPFLVRRAAELAAGGDVPLQLHTGFGDADIDLPSADPALLRPLFTDPRTEACQVVLLHTYPFTGGAAYLAGLYPQVHMDLSLAIPLAEPAAERLVREALGLCPASKLLAASDGHSFPEMHWWGATVWRRTLGRVLAAEVRSGGLDEAAALGMAERVLGGNARRLYHLGD
jgi:uncharacterized protein